MEWCTASWRQHTCILSFLDLLSFVLSPSFAFARCLPMVPFFRLLFLLSVRITIVLALFIVTVDDQTGDPLTGNKPIYTPSGSDGGWDQGSTCSNCPVQPDPSKAFNGTWHYALFQSNDAFPRAVTISFTGAYFN